MSRWGEKIQVNHLPFSEYFVFARSKAISRIDGQMKESIREFYERLGVNSVELPPFACLLPILTNWKWKSARQKTEQPRFYSFALSIVCVSMVVFVGIYRVECERMREKERNSFPLFECIKSK